MGFSPPEKIVKKEETTIFGIPNGGRQENSNPNTPPGFNSGIEVKGENENENEIKVENDQNSIGQKRTQTQAKIEDELDMIQEPQAPNDNNKS